MWHLDFFGSVSDVKVDSVFDEPEALAAFLLGVFVVKDAFVVSINDQVSRLPGC